MADFPYILQNSDDQITQLKLNFYPTTTETGFHIPFDATNVGIEHNNTYPITYTNDNNLTDFWGESILFLIVFLIGYVLTLIITFSIRRKKRKNSKFLRLLKIGIEEGIIADLVDIKNIYEGIFPKKSNAGNPELDTLLQKYLTEINEMPSTYTEPIDQKNLITKIILEYQESHPYEDLPIEEKSIIRDIKEYMKHNNQRLLDAKLTELTSLISTKNREYKKAEKKNKRDHKFTIISITLAIIFGLPQLYNWGKSIFLYLLNK